MAFRFKSIIPFSIFLVLLTCFQYFYCASQAPPGWKFLGLTCDAVDSHPYFSLIDEARQGHFFLNNLYTGEPEKPVYWNLFWWGLGNVARVTGLSDIGAFQAGRVVFSFLLILLLAKVSMVFLPTREERWTAFWLMTVGTGFGWLLLPLWGVVGHPVYSSDLIIPEGYAITSMLWKPHMAFSMVVQISALCLYAVASVRGITSWAIGAALLALVLGLAHPFHLVTMYAILLVYGALRAYQPNPTPALPLTTGEGARLLPATSSRWQPLLFGFILMAFSAPAILFFVRMVGTSLVMASWKKQNICLTPMWWWFFLVGYAPQLIILAMFPRRLIALRDRSPLNLFLLVWLFCNALLLYTDGIIPFERRLVQGIQVPLTLLAVQLFFTEVKGRVEAQKAALIGFPTLTLVWIISAMPTTLYHLTATSFVALPVQSPGLFYASPDELKVSAFLRDHTPVNAVVLAPEVEAAWLPRLAQRRVFVGHPMQTAFYSEKEPLEKAFYNGTMSPGQASALLSGKDIGYVLWPSKARVSFPAGASTVRIFQTDQLTVYAQSDISLDAYFAAPAP